MFVAASIVTDVVSSGLAATGALAIDFPLFDLLKQRLQNPFAIVLPAEWCSSDSFGGKPCAVFAFGFPQADVQKQLFDFFRLSWHSYAPALSLMRYLMR